MEHRESLSRQRKEFFVFVTGTLSVKVGLPYDHNGKGHVFYDFVLSNLISFLIGSVFLLIYKLIKGFVIKLPYFVYILSQT